MGYRVGIILFIFLLLGCGGSRTASSDGQASEQLATREIIRNHNRVSPDFNTLAGRVRVAYREEDKTQSMTVSLRMEKDRQIWIKASILGITLAKVYMTQDQVQYYETISNTYFEGDFSLISDWLGTQVNFKKTQAILLGQAIFELNGGFNSRVASNTYFLEPRRPIRDLIYTLALHPENFKVVTTEVAQPAQDRHFTLKYGPYQKLEAGYFPSQVWIDSYQGDQKTQIEVTYRKIDIDIPLSFPFSIPTGYQKIELGQ